jgi:two-component system sensor histidine kinase DesK
MPARGPDATVHVVHEAGDEAPGAAAAASSARWLEKRPPRVLLAGLLGYVGATAAGVASYSHGTGAIAGYVILAGFCGCFVGVVVWVGSLDWFWWMWPLVGAMSALGLAEVAFARGDAFYLAAVLLVPVVAHLQRRAWPVVAAVAAAGLVAPWAVRSWHESLGWGPAISIFFTSLLVLAFSETLSSNQALHDAQAEIARLASQAERARIARDLHDLLGHSLTAITMKAELAGRLVAPGLSDAAREIGEIEALSRQALADVRAAVSDYRDLTVAGELARARELLRVSGVTAELPGSTDGVDPAHQELLAWAIREGVTNVARHAQATRCTVTLSRHAVEITDDGTCATPAHKGDLAIMGHGLSGLAERIAAAAGTFEAGPRSPQGWRLWVSLEPAGTASP